jgi:hypothetical protein
MKLVSIQRINYGTIGDRTKFRDINGKRLRVGDLVKHNNGYWFVAKDLIFGYRGFGEIRFARSYKTLKPGKYTGSQHKNWFLVVEDDYFNKKK